MAGQRHPNAKVMIFARPPPLAERLASEETASHAEPSRRGGDDRRGESRDLRLRGLGARAPRAGSLHRGRRAARELAAALRRRARDPAGALLRERRRALRARTARRGGLHLQRGQRAPRRRARRDRARLRPHAREADRDHARGLRADRAGGEAARRARHRRPRAPLHPLLQRAPRHVRSGDARSPALRAPPRERLLLAHGAQLRARQLATARGRKPDDPRQVLPRPRPPALEPRTGPPPLELRIARALPRGERPRRRAGEVQRRLPRRGGVSLLRAALLPRRARRLAGERDRRGPQPRGAEARARGGPVRPLRLPLRQRRRRPPDHLPRARGGRLGGAADARPLACRSALAPDRRHARERARALHQGGREPARGAPPRPGRSRRALHPRRGRRRTRRGR